MISAVVPVYKESVSLINSAINHLSQFDAVKEVLVVATRRDPQLAEIKQALTQASAEDMVKLVIVETPGRAQQMNQGAACANGEILVFMHCDTRLPSAADALIIQGLEDHNWGRFDLRFKQSHLAFQVIAWFINKRSRLTSISTGDQVLFARSQLFKQLNGFPDQILMEDVEFCKRAKRKGAPANIAAKVTTSERRWQQNGIFRTILLMWGLRFLYWVGVSPKRLHRLYHQVR